MNKSHWAFIFMVQNTENNNKIEHLEKDTKEQAESNLSYWKPVILFYAKTTSWIIFPLILGIFAGKYVSKTVGSQVLFFIFLMLGFAVSCFGIYREIKEYKKNL